MLSYAKSGMKYQFGRPVQSMSVLILHPVHISPAVTPETPAPITATVTALFLSILLIHVLLYAVRSCLSCYVQYFNSSSVYRRPLNLALHNKGTKYGK